MLEHEEALWAAGYSRIGGVDEVGAGALYGPLLAACVILAPDRIPAGLRDSKQLTPRQRERLYPQICQAAQAYAVDSASVAEVEQLGPKEASRLAMKRAVEALPLAPDYLLVDYHRLDLPLPQCAFAHADAQSASVAAAAIVAKVTRDHLITALAAGVNDAYDLARNKGYGSARHRAALEELGPTAGHRRTYLSRILAGTRWAEGLPGVTPETPQRRRRREGTV